MKKVILSSILAVGLAAGSAYAVNNGYTSGSLGHHLDGTYMLAMMGGGGGYGGGGYMLDDGHMGGYYGNGIGTMYQGFGGPGQGKWDDGRQQRFFEETVQLRRQLNARQFDYEEARRNPSTSRAELDRIERDLRDIRYTIDSMANGL